MHDHGANVFCFILRHQRKHKRAILHHNTCATRSNELRPVTFVRSIRDPFREWFGVAPFDPSTLPATRGIRDITHKQFQLQAALSPTHTLVGHIRASRRRKHSVALRDCCGAEHNTQTLLSLRCTDHSACPPCILSLTSPTTVDQSTQSRCTPQPHQKKRAYLIDHLDIRHPCGPQRKQQLLHQH
ncbi:hypothetical protein TcG_13441 [Trypanosoma cruzi]|nr:hypothetical protein TcG_13441 [Trypanosoma cruzi]